MSEEEILKECTELAENEHHELGDCWDEEYSSSAIFGLIMLYKQTKESEQILANKLQKVNIKLNQEKERSFHFEKSNEMFADSYSKMAKAFNIKSYAINANIIINHINENFISKDKIKERLAELENKSGGNSYHVQAKINAEKNILKELLEEK